MALGVGQQGVGALEQGFDFGCDGVELGALAQHRDRGAIVQQAYAAGKNLVAHLQLRPVGLVGLHEAQMELVAQPQKLALELKREGGDGVGLQARRVFDRLRLAHKSRHHDAQAQRHGEGGERQP